MGCPYTWFRSTFGLNSSAKPGIAEHLKVRVIRDGEEVVNVSLPADSARRLMDLIPESVVRRIVEEEIPLGLIHEDLEKAEILQPRKIFTLEEPHRTVDVWLE